MDTLRKTYYTGNEYKIIKSRSILYDLAETGDATKTLTEIFEKKMFFLILNLLK